jgi:hypothetical protein
LGPLQGRGGGGRGRVCFEVVQGYGPILTLWQGGAVRGGLLQGAVEPFGLISRWDLGRVNLR